MPEFYFKLFYKLLAVLGHHTPVQCRFKFYEIYRLNVIVDLKKKSRKNPTNQLKRHADLSPCFPPSTHIQF
jgi:hypothetical protein